MKQKRQRRLNKALDDGRVKKTNALQLWWKNCCTKYPGITQFIVFFVVCNGVTVLQMLLMPVFKWIFGFTSLVQVNFQILQVGHNLNGSPYYIFDYAAGSIASGGGGGLAYFLAVEITMGIAQIVNFISQRKVTFKSTGSIWKPLFWYVLAYIIITIGAAALQGVYKTPLYEILMQKLGNGTGTTVADVLTMLINSAISFWVFFPIMKWIFKK